MADDIEFESGEAGASESIPMQCSALRKNGHVIIKGHACKIVDMSTSKTGKHGHAKVHLVGIDIFNGTKHEENCPSTHNISVPHVKRQEYSINDLDEDGFLELMDEEGGIRSDLKFEPGDIQNTKEFKCMQDLKNTMSDDKYSLTASVTKSLNQEKVLEIKKKSNN